MRSAGSLLRAARRLRRAGRRQGVLRLTPVLAVPVDDEGRGVVGGAYRPDVGTGDGGYAPEHVEVGGRGVGGGDVPPARVDAVPVLGQRLALRTAVAASRRVDVADRPDVVRPGKRHAE